jgi:hypothetical protein
MHQVSLVRWWCARDPIHDRVAQLHVGRRHVDLGAQDAKAVGVLPAAHLLEPVQIVGNRAVAKRAFFARLVIVAACGANRFYVAVVDVCFTGLDELYGIFVKLAEIVRRKVLGLPSRTEPAHVSLID